MSDRKAEISERLITVRVVQPRAAHRDFWVRNMYMMMMVRTPKAP